MGLTKSLDGLLDFNENLLTSTTNNEDCSIFRLKTESDYLNLVQTLDFITPIVDDPFVFGQIAAANALSDIFAMNARVLTALNITSFDDCNFDLEILSEILQGGKSKVVECGGLLVGGHTIQSGEIFYGLSVTGLVGENFWQNNTAKPGDALILTKPLGFGILGTALKSKLMEPYELKEFVSLMQKLNFYALEALFDLPVSAATDISGFGFLGHLTEMLNENISFEVYEPPILSTAKKYEKLGIISEGAYKNLDFIKKFTNKEPDLLLCDPQTSGGLLISIDENYAIRALNRLKAAGYEHARIVATATPKSKFDINLF